MSIRYHRPAILNQISPEKNYLIEASAGTGKTYTIEHLVIELILAGIRLPHILLVTFTEKATQELGERIRGSLLRLLHLPEGAGSELAPGESWEIHDQARNLLERALFEFEEASINTIHGYCNRVLQELAFENGQRFEMEQKNQSLVFEETFFEYLRDEVLNHENPARDVLMLYLESHPQALDKNSRKGNLFATCRKLLWEKGALLPRVEDLEGLRHRWEKWRDLFDESILQTLMLLNIHSGSQKKAVSVLTDLGLLLADTGSSWLKGLNWLSAQDDLKYSNFNKKAKPGAINREDELPPSFSQFMQEYHLLKEKAPNLEAILLSQIMSGLRKAVERRKRLKGWFDFDDMIALVAAGIRQQKGPLIQALRSKHAFALIDEFQDTDEDQWTIFSTIFLESPTHRLFLIGDPKQSIYRFRGADIHTYLRAREQIRAGGGEILSLGHNFRSSPEMIAGFNKLFSCPEIFQGQIRYQQVAAGKKDNRFLQDYTEPLVWWVPQPEIEGKDHSANLLKATFSNQITREIQVLLQHPPLLPNGSSLPARDIAILVRSRSEAELMAEALAARQIPYAFYKQGGLFQSREAWELFDMLQAIEYCHNDAYLFKALLTSFFPVSMEDLVTFQTIPALWRGWFTDWHKQAYETRDYRALFNEIFNQTRIFERLLFAADAERSVTNFEHLADILKKEGHRMDLRQLLRLFRDHLDKDYQADEDLLRLESEKEAVQIMTIHASKGLEFPVVFLFGGYSNVLRSQSWHSYHDEGQGRVVDLCASSEKKSLSALEEQAEIERLYYVALTRAAFRLYITSSHFDCSTRQATLMVNLGRSLLSQGLHPEIRFQEIPVLPEYHRRSQQEISAEFPADWQPQFDQDHQLSEQLRQFRWSRNDFRLTSYTRIAHKRHATLGLLSVEMDLIRGLDESPAPAIVESSNLPKGANTGICLHEILERAGALKLDRYDQYLEWREDAEVRRILEHHLRQSGLAPYYNAASQVIWRSLTTQVLEGVALGRLAPQDRLHEIDFHFPFENDQKELMLTGSIDLAFRRLGRYYFADWKSDTLEDYQPGFLRKKVNDDYTIQYQIYLWAMLRWLRIKDRQQYEDQFGGFFYLFIRGMGEGSGIYFHRPDWDEVLQYEKLLCQRAR